MWKQTIISSVLGWEQLLGIVIFALYFLSIFFLFSIIIQSISERNRASGSVLSWSHVSLALVSFVFTWYCECLSHFLGFTDTPKLPDDKKT